MVRDGDGRPQEDPLAVHCFCVCSGSALLGDLLGVSRSRERDLLSVLLIYPRFFFYVFIVYYRVLFCCMLMSVDCFGLVVSTCPPTPGPTPFSVWPHLFCGAGDEKRRGGQLKWSLAFRLYIGSFPSSSSSSYQHFVVRGLQNWPMAHYNCSYRVTAVSKN